MIPAPASLFLFGCEMYQIHPQCPVWVYLKLLLFEKNSVIRVFSIVYESLFCKDLFQFLSLWTCANGHYPLSNPQQYSLKKKPKQLFILCWGTADEQCPHSFR